MKKLLLLLTVTMALTLAGCSLLGPPRPKVNKLPVDYSNKKGAAKGYMFVAAEDGTLRGVATNKVQKFYRTTRTVNIVGQTMNIDMTLDIREEQLYFAYDPQTQIVMSYRIPSLIQAGNNPPSGPGEIRYCPEVKYFFVQSREAKERFQKILAADLTTYNKTLGNEAFMSVFAGAQGELLNVGELTLERPRYFKDDKVAKGEYTGMLAEFIEARYSDSPQIKSVSSVTGDFHYTYITDNIKELRAYKSAKAAEN